MKIFFTYSWGDSDQSVKSNFEIAESVFPNIEKIYGKNSILDTYKHLSFLSSEPFVWIDSDNIVYPDAAKILDIDKPCILMAENEYGICYGHGGIKRCNANMPVRHGSIDVTYYLDVTPIEIVGSFHSLGTGWLKDRAIFAEMIKCSLKGESYILHKWISSRPDIWEHVHSILQTSDITHIITLIQNRLAFKEYYENSMCSNLQK